MKKSKMNKLLNEIEKEGLLIKGFHNGIPNDIVVKNKHAEKVKSKHFTEYEYILGHVPHSLEHIGNLDYEIVFIAIESIAFKLNSEMQKRLHDYASELLLNNEEIDAKEFIKNVKKWKIPSYIKTGLFSEIDNWKKSIIDELRNIVTILHKEKNMISEQL